MAFDFISYITQQTIQQHPHLFPNQGKEIFPSPLITLVALHIIQLRASLNRDIHTSFNQIVEKETNTLRTAVWKHITTEPYTKKYFSDYQTQLNDANQQVATILFDELNQLEQTAHLGQNGIYELIDGQIPWIQQYVDNSWFWDSTDLPEYKLVKQEVSEEVNIDTVMHQFNELLQQSNPISEQHLDKEQSTAITQLYLILNPILALLIIIFIFLQLCR